MAPEQEPSRERDQERKRAHGPRSGRRSVVVVGGGPRGSGLLERLVANAPELLGDLPVTVHVVEPHTFGAGRIWRYDQSPLLWANSQAEDMTMFTDASCRIAGPVTPGPTFLEWAHRPRPQGTPAPPELEAERGAVHGMTFPTRRLLTEYLAWSFWRSVRRAPATVTVRVHADRAVDVTDTADGRQLVHLERAPEPLVADVVLLAQGHLPTRPLGASAALADEAARHGLTYLPEEYTADSDLGVLAPGEPVVVRGAGLAFVDLAVLVTQGRGGRFEDAPDGRLVYRRSGAEPVLLVGSRRGVPYHSKITYRLPGPRAPLPRFLTRAAVDALLDGPPATLDFRAQVWPLLAKELAFGHYHELFASHPDAVRGTWEEFDAALATHPWGGPELAAAVAGAVPDPADRFDPERLDRPLRDVRLPDADALQRHLVAYVEADLARRADPRHSADLGFFNALLAVFEPLGRLLGSGRLSPASAVRDVPWFVGFFSYVASGPPPRRLRELVALVEAGVVRFLGADVQVRVRPADGDRPAAFVATSPTVPGEVSAPALVEARVPGTSLARTADPLLAALHARGAVSEAVLPGADGAPAVPTGRVRVTPDAARVVAADGTVHPTRFAFGAGTSAATAGAFSRPGTDAAFFRQNDHAAREVWRTVAALAQGGPVATGPAPVPGDEAEVELEVEELSPDHPEATRLLAALASDYAARYAGGDEVVHGEPPQDFAAPHGAWLGLRSQGRIVAAGAYRRADAVTAELERIWTDPHHRGRGLARRVVTELERYAAARGYRRVELTTGPRQADAERLYLALGYTRLGPADDAPEGPVSFAKDLDVAARFGTPPAPVTAGPATTTGLRRTS